MNSDCLSIVLMMSNYDTVVRKINRSGIYIGNGYFYKLLGIRDYRKDFRKIFRDYYYFTKKLDYCRVYSMCNFIDDNKTKDSISCIHFFIYRNFNNNKKIKWLKNLYNVKSVWLYLLFTLKSF